MDVSSRLGVEAMASVGERADEDGHMIPYVGETDDLSTEFDNHRKANCFRRHDANRISYSSTVLKPPGVLWSRT